VPARTVDVERLGRVDLLVVSHRHPDHFDLPSLARLPRDADAICPADPLIMYALRELGFANVHPVHPMAPIMSADFELYPTRSERESIPETGMVFRDASGVFWNQVDTPLADATIGEVDGRFGPPDLLFAMYASRPQSRGLLAARARGRPSAREAAGATRRLSTRPARSVRIRPHREGRRFP
jgi:UDP-MurNAc hydroxylase